MKLRTLILLPGLLFTAAAQAQVPAGSYSETCNQARVTNNVLHAVCRNRDGAWAPTTLPLPCGNVENLDGRLRCISAYPPPPKPAKPAAAAPVPMAPAPKKPYTLILAPTQGGTVLLQVLAVSQRCTPPNKCTYQISTRAYAKAEPAKGFAFKGWTGVCAGQKETCPLSEPGGEVGVLFAPS